MLDYFKYRLRYRFAREWKQSKPVDVTLELASVCDMGCGYCYHADGNKVPFTKGFMNFNMACDIISQAADLDVPAMKFNWKGESTLHPEFFEITEFAKQKATKRRLIDRLTNSNFNFKHNRDLILFGLCNQTKVKISYDSFDKAIFEAQRIRGEHDVVTKNIDDFYNHPLRKDTQIVIQCVRTKANKDEDFHGLVRKRWPSCRVSIRDCVDGRRIETDLEITHRKRDFSERQSCIQAHARVIFNHEGIAFPCCPTVKEDLPIGDIRKQSLIEIWNSPVALSLRDDLKSKKAFERDPCLNCSSFETFKNYRPSFNS